MPETQSEGRTCHLRLALSRYHINTSYDAKVGIKRECVLSGRIDDPDLDVPGHWSPHFHDKSVRVEISSPPNPEWLEELLGASDADKAFGLVQVNADVEPKRFEDEGETVEIEPVLVMLKVSADIFEVLRSQAADASHHHRVMWATLTLVGEALPKPDSDFIFLKDLDVSALRVYAVGNFEISDTIYTNDARRRVLSMKCDGGKGRYGTNISILLTHVRYDITVERSLVRSIMCEGKVIGGKGKPYDGVRVTVEFFEHEVSGVTGELPERAWFGEFGYFAELQDEYSSTAFFSLQLKHVPEDVRGLLLPLFSQDVGTQVILNANLAVEKEQLLGTTDKLRGKIRFYEFEVRRDLILDEDEEQQLDRTADLESSMSNDDGTSWADWRREIDERMADAPSDAPDSIRRKVGQTQKAHFRLLFIDAAFQRCTERGLRSGSEEAVVELNRAEDTGHKLSFFINSKEFYVSMNDMMNDMPAEYWTDDQIRKRGLMSWNVPSERLIYEAKKGNRFNIDIDLFQDGIGVFLDHDLRPVGVERIILKALIDSVVSEFMESSFSTNLITGKSLTENVTKTNLHPLTAFFLGRFKEALSSIVIVIGLFVASYFGLFGAEIALFGGLGLFALWVVSLLYSLAYLLTDWSQWKSGDVQQQQPKLVDAMIGVHREISGSAPISISRLREFLSKAEELGAEWPSSTYAILDDLESRKIDRL